VNTGRRDLFAVETGKTRKDDRVIDLIGQINSGALL
jgi:hypothetical protein